MRECGDYELADSYARKAKYLNIVSTIYNIIFYVIYLIIIIVVPIVVTKSGWLMLNKIQEPNELYYFKIFY